MLIRTDLQVRLAVVLPRLHLISPCDELLLEEVIYFSVSKPSFQAASRSFKVLLYIGAGAGRD
jgi:hypothetical protein